MPYVILTLVLVALDQLVKYLVLQNIPLGGLCPVIDQRINDGTHINPFTFIFPLREPLNVISSTKINASISSV